VPGIFDRF